MSKPRKVSAALTDNGSTPSLELGPSGRLVMTAAGDFGTPAGTVNLEVRMPNGNWVLSGTISQSLGADGEVAGVLAHGLNVRATLGGATSPDLQIEVVTG